MTIAAHRAQVQTASGLDVLAGIWLIISPFIVGYSAITGATVNDVILGIIIGILAAIRFFGAYEAAFISWINVILGIWVLISPWVLDYFSISTSALSNNVVMGIIVIILAAWSALATTSPMPEEGDAAQKPM